MKYIVAFVALTEKHTNTQLANFHHLQQWTFAPPSFQACICCPIRLLDYAKYLYVPQYCICCPGIGWDLSSDCHRHIWMCWCRTKRGGGIGAPAWQWGQSTGVRIAIGIHLSIQTNFNFQILQYLDLLFVFLKKSNNQWPPPLKWLHFDEGLVNINKARQGRFRLRGCQVHQAPTKPSSTPKAPLSQLSCN